MPAETGVLMENAAGLREFWPAEFEHHVMMDIFGPAPD